MNKVIAMCTITMLMTGCILPPSRYYGDGPYYGDGLLTGLMHSARAASALAHVAIPRNSAVLGRFGPKAISRMLLKSEIASGGRCVDPFSQRRERES